MFGLRGDCRKKIRGGDWLGEHRGRERERAGGREGERRWERKRESVEKMLSGKLPACIIPS